MTDPNAIVAAIDQMHIDGGLFHIRHGRSDKVEQGTKPGGQSETIDRRAFYPFPRQVELAQRLLRTIAQGYESRDYLACEFRETPVRVNSQGRKSAFSMFEPIFADLKPAEFEILIGLPGAGKTHTVAQTLNAMAKRLPTWSKPTTPQVPYIAMSCSDEHTMRGFCTRLLREFEKATGNASLEHAFGHATVSADDMPKTVVQVALAFGLACIVFDDLQALAAISEAERGRILRLFRLIRDSGIPVVLLGSPPALGVIEADGEMRRRSFGRLTTWDILANDADWEAFVDCICPSEMAGSTAKGEHLAELLHRRSQGIPGLVKVLANSFEQRAQALGDDAEAIELESMADEALMLLQAPLQALASKDPSARLAYPDFHPPRAELRAREREFRRLRRTEVLQEDDKAPEEASPIEDEIEAIVLDEETKKTRAARLQAASDIVMRQILRDAHLPPDKAEATIKAAWDNHAGTHKRTAALIKYVFDQVALHAEDIRKKRRSARLQAEWDPSDLRGILSGELDAHEALRQSGYGGPKALQFD